MNTVKKLIKSIYRDLKSDTQKRKAVKGEKRFSKKPVDPAEQRYKQKRSIERSDWRPYDDDDLLDFNHDWSDTKKEENEKYIRKSRKKEVTKKDINRRINNKVGGEYAKNEFDEDIPF